VKKLEAVAAAVPCRVCGKSVADDAQARANTVRLFGPKQMTDAQRAALAALLRPCVIRCACGRPACDPTQAPDGVKHRVAHMVRCVVLGLPIENESDLPALEAPKLVETT
jgi:hypothetical protein